MTVSVTLCEVSSDDNAKALWFNFEQNKNYEKSLHTFKNDKVC